MNRGRRTGQRKGESKVDRRETRVVKVATTESSEQIRGQGKVWLQKYLSLGR